MVSVIFRLIIYQDTLYTQTFEYTHIEWKIISAL